MDSSRRVLDFPNTYGGGEFNGCEGRIRPFLDDTPESVPESIMLQKTRKARAGGELKNGNFRGLVMPLCSDRPRKMTSLRWRDSIVMPPPSLGGLVCDIVGAVVGIRSFELAFLKNKRLPYFKKILGSSKLKKVRITNVLVSFLSVCPLLIDILSGRLYVLR